MTCKLLHLSGNITRNVIPTSKNWATSRVCHVDSCSLHPPSSILYDTEIQASLGSITLYPTLSESTVTPIKWKESTQAPPTKATYHSTASSYQLIPAFWYYYTRLTPLRPTTRVSLHTLSPRFKKPTSNTPSTAHIHIKRIAVARNTGTTLANRYCPRSPISTSPTSIAHPTLSLLIGLTLRST